MSLIVHARIDSSVRATLRRLRRLTHWSDSEIIRRGLKSLERETVPLPRRRVIGLGAFHSGVPDLATNKRHLDDYGK